MTMELLLILEGIFGIGYVVGMILKLFLSRWLDRWMSSKVILKSVCEPTLYVVIDEIVCGFIYICGVGVIFQPVVWLVLKLLSMHGVSI